DAQQRRRVGELRRVAAYDRGATSAAPGVVRSAAARLGASCEPAAFRDRRPPAHSRHPGPHGRRAGDHVPPPPPAGPPRPPRPRRSPATQGPTAGEQAPLLPPTPQRGRGARAALGEEFSWGLTDARIRGAASRLGPRGEPIRVERLNRAERGGLEVTVTRFT